MARIELDAKVVERLDAAMRRFPTAAADEVTKVLHRKGKKLITDSIYLYMPRSGRTFEGKDPAAKDSKSLRDRDSKSKLSVTISTKPTWHYLYFPDDGTTTKHHAGNQQFFKRGAEYVSGKVGDACVEAIIKKFGEGV